MNLHRRIAKLEAGTADLGLAAAFCPTCGAPKPGYDLLVLMVDEDDKPLDPVCSDCGLRVDAEGRSRWGRPMPRSGKVIQKKIVLPRL